MKKILSFIVFLLTLCPILDITDASIVSAQSATYENGSFWLPNLGVSSTNEKCDKCNHYYDPEEEHICTFKCDYCDGSFESLNDHYRNTYSCGNAAGYDYGNSNNNGDSNNNGEGNSSTGNGNSNNNGFYYCPNCGVRVQSDQMCNRCGVVIIGKKNNGTDVWYEISYDGFNGLHSSSTISVDIQENEEVVDTIPIGSLPSSGRISTQSLLLLAKYGVVIAKMNLPEQFHKQTLKYECVIRGIANISQILGKDYDVAYSVLSDIADKLGYDFTERGILDKNVHKLFDDYITLSRYQCTQTFVENQINNHNNVLVTIRTENGPHMVTVLAYDSYYYYCAAGYNDINIISKDRLDTSRSAFIVKQFNGVYK